MASLPRILLWVHEYIDEQPSLPRLLWYSLYRHYLKLKKQNSWRTHGLLLLLTLKLQGNLTNRVLLLHLHQYPQSMHLFNKVLLLKHLQELILWTMLLHQDLVYIHFCKCNNLLIFEHMMQINLDHRFLLQ